MADEVPIPFVQALNFIIPLMAIGLGFDSVNSEFNRRTLEVLRQPLEDGTVTISLALHSTTFPADMMLVVALNPCPCGYRGDPRRQCNCTVPQIERYMSKISGPLLDRIDLHIEVPAVPYKICPGRDLASAMNSFVVRTGIEG